MTQLDEITFTQADVELFAALSHDHNPLHVDSNYARRTPFGQCVVYGILGALGALRELVQEAPVHIKTLEVKFHRPLFIDTAYKVVSRTDQHGRIEVSLARGDSTKLVVGVEYESARCAPWTSRPPVSTEVVARPEPSDFDPLASPNSFAGRYAISPAHIGELTRAIGFRATCIHPLQLAALCWSSYLVGMEVPGKQALFASLSIDFVDRPDEVALELRYDAQLDSYDADTSMLGISAQLSCPTSRTTFATVKIDAARRPAPVEYSIAQLEASVGRSDTLSGKLVLVTGSSRGLGSQIALGFCLHGADVILHCKDRVQDAAKIAAVAESLGRTCTVIQGDLQKHETWVTLAREVRSRGDKLDVFVNNAYPPAIPLAFGEMTDDVVDARICGPIRSAVDGFSCLLPLLDPSGCIVNISSEYTQKAPRHFSYYVTAKAAVEGLVVALAAEYPRVRFITVRPPKLLTDMTNDIIPGLQGKSPMSVVAAILASVENTSSQTNYSVVEGVE